MPADQSLPIPPEFAGQTVAAAIKRLNGQMSWSEVKRLITARQIRLNGALCLDESRRVRAGEVLTIASKPGPPVPRANSVRIIFRDQDLIIVDKPAGIQTTRRPEERHFSDEKKLLQPALDELVGHTLQRLNRSMAIKVRAVHRLDRDTSGLMLFALSARAEIALVKMFKAHKVSRSYMAVVHGHFKHRRTIESWLVRDRGDGLRGSIPTPPPSSSPPESADRAVTHVRPLERFIDPYTIVECQLETGRTHQIRIHLSELGHRLCGELIYTRPQIGGETLPDTSGAPRQALHSKDLRLAHPITGRELHYTTPLPTDLAQWLEAIRVNKRR